MHTTSGVSPSSLATSFTHYHSLVRLPPSGPRCNHCGLLLLLRHLEQLLEDFAILLVNDGGHLKLPLKSFNLLLEGEGELGHLLPLLHLLEKFNQTKKREKLRIKLYL